MELIPTNEEVIAMLRQTGALREGHFEYPNGMHANEFLQVALAFRCYEWAKVLSVGLSRRLRADPEVRAIIKQLSIVCPTTSGLPIGFGVVEPEPGEKILLVDDILRSGRRFTELRSLIESKGATVVGLAVAVYQPNPTVADFGDLPIFHLAKLSAMYYKDSASCDLCKKGVPVETIWA